MVSARRYPIGRTALLPAIALAMMAAGGIAIPAAAQDNSADVRVRRLEAEVRALQRKVFPGGAGQTFQPEITAPPATGAAAGPPTTTATTDLLNRMTAVEAQMASMTAQIELNTNRIAQVEAKLNAAPASGAAAGPPDPSSPPVTTAPSASVPPAATPPPAASAPSDSRVDAVRAIQKPQTADAGDDEYSYGYRLFDAKFYPEAEQQLRLYLQKYPKHTRVSYARNLIGRAYLTDGDAREAAKWFLQNYQADKAGARAPDSLLYLARSMKTLNDTKRACVALGEFSSNYPAESAGRLKPDYDDTRKGLTCS
jgi:TolA-binding protein